VQHEPSQDRKCSRRDAVTAVGAGLVAIAAAGPASAGEASRRRAESRQTEELTCEINLSNLLIAYKGETEARQWKVPKFPPFTVSLPDLLAGKISKEVYLATDDDAMEKLTIKFQRNRAFFPEVVAKMAERRAAAARSGKQTTYATLAWAVMDALEVLRVNSDGTEAKSPKGFVDVNVDVDFNF